LWEGTGSGANTWLVCPSYFEKNPVSAGPAPASGEIDQRLFGPGVSCPHLRARCHQSALNSRCAFGSLQGRAGKMLGVLMPAVPDGSKHHYFENSPLRCAVHSRPAWCARTRAVANSAPSRTVLTVMWKSLECGHIPRMRVAYATSAERASHMNTVKTAGPAGKLARSLRSRGFEGSLQGGVKKNRHIG